MKPYQIILQEYNGFAIELIDDDALYLKNCFVNVEVNFAKEKDEGYCSEQKTSFGFGNVFFLLEDVNELHGGQVEIAYHYQF